MSQKLETGRVSVLPAGESEDDPLYTQETGTPNVNVTNSPLPTEDTGANTNPEKYITDNAFSTQVVNSTGAAAAVLYDATTTPARTAGLSIYVYEILVYNNSGAAATVHLELSDGTERSVKIALANGDTAVVSLAKPIEFGDNDIYYQASAANVEVQVTGLEI